jgi:fatty-acid peroxygenase
MSAIPRDPALDSTLSILKDGYEFIWKRCQRWNTDLFEARVMGKKAICIHGREAAQIFYDGERFQRQGALPRRVVTSLFGKGAVHSLDDQAHHHRKSAFLSLMSPQSLARLMELTAKHWRDSVLRWENQPSIVLFDEAQRVLTAGVCEWAGVPVKASELPKRAHDLGAMVDAFGGVGPRLWKGKLARMRSERWIERLVERVRSGRLQPAPGTPLHVMANHRELNGELLDARVAAVELLNVIRPTVAVAWYIAFAALALHQHEAARERLRAEPYELSAGTYADMFMQEVRRFYPFTPYLGAKVRNDFEWRGHRFERGTLVLLDVYGTAHDARLWEAPGEFRPERFERWDGDAFDFIPQGGGSRSLGHRCPGEWITMHNIDLALHILTRCMTYEVAPGQDLTIALDRMPTRPKSGLILTRVRATKALHAKPPQMPSETAGRSASEARDQQPACPVHARPAPLL